MDTSIVLTGILKSQDEHCDYKWVTKDSELLDDFIKAKLENI